MFNQITGADIYAGIKMLRAAGRSIFLLVEGSTEYQFLYAHVSDDLELVNCHGCQNLDTAKDLANAASDRDVAALRDRDWIGILKPEPVDDTLFLTDLYDLDSTIILTTDAGRRIMDVFSDSDSLRRWKVQNSGLTPLEAVQAIAAKVGLLRLATERHGLGVRTDRTPLGPPVTDLSSLVVNDAELIALAVSRSGQVRQPTHVVKQRFDEELSVGHPSERLCCGHDLGSAVTLLLAGPWGGAKHQGAFVLTAIRAALSRAEFRALGFVGPVGQWASSRGKSAWAA